MLKNIEIKNTNIKISFFSCCVFNINNLIYRFIMQKHNFKQVTKFDFLSYFCHMCPCISQFRCISSLNSLFKCTFKYFSVMTLLGNDAL